MVIKVCVGSSCHLKGSYLIIQKIQEIIKAQKLEQKVELKAAFCMGDCINGIPVEIDGERVLHCGIDNIEEIVLNKLAENGE